MACLQILIPRTPVGMALKRRAGHKEDPEAGHFAFCLLHFLFLILHSTFYIFTFFPLIFLLSNLFLLCIFHFFLHFTFTQKEACHKEDPETGHKRCDKASL